MEPNRHYPQAGFYPPSEQPAECVTAELVADDAPPPAPVVRRGVLLPLFLFLATCATTLLTGANNDYKRGDAPPEWRVRSAVMALQAGEPAYALGQLKRVALAGMGYAVPLLVILVCHEMGHFIQARRYGVPATWPFFIPMPGSPIGTMGAVIAMDPRYGDRKALFDIGISGPLAGLIPTLIFCVIGLRESQVGPIPPHASVLGDPLLLTWLAKLVIPRLPGQGEDILLSPMAYAGWVGLLITSLNLFPVGQLDGGHVLFGLLGQKAHFVARWVMRIVVAAIFISAIVYGKHGAMGWLLMVFLIYMMGTDHPPTTDDHVPLGGWRHALGWLTLAFLPLGFTPIPFVR